MAVKVTVESLGGKIFHGVVDNVSPTHDKGSSWMNPDRKVFPAVVRLVGDTSQLRPGMTCSVEIIIETIQDALIVPVQAVRTIEGENFCMVYEEDELKRRAVKVGSDNGLHVQILEGLEEGDQVQVSRAALAVGKTLSSNTAPLDMSSEDETKTDDERGDRDESRQRSGRGGENREGSRGSREGSGGRRNFDMSAYEAKLKEKATPEDLEAYEKAKADEDRRAQFQLLRKYDLIQMGGGNRGGGQPWRWKPWRSRP